MGKTITLPKTEYDKLKRQSDIYRFLAGRVFSSVVKNPVEEVVDDFRKTGLYSEEFLKDLEDGLRETSFVEL